MKCDICKKEIVLPHTGYHSLNLVSKKGDYYNIVIERTDRISSKTPILINKPAREVHLCPTCLYAMLCHNYEYHEEN